MVLRTRPTACCLNFNALSIGMFLALAFSSVIIVAPTSMSRIAHWVANWTEPTRSRGRSVPADGYGGGLHDLPDGKDLFGRPDSPQTKQDGQDGERDSLRSDGPHRRSISKAEKFSGCGPERKSQM